MKRFFFIIIFFVILIIHLFPQTGDIQIYCVPGVLIYVDDVFKGKTHKDMSGLYIENLSAGVINVRAVKNGYITVSKTATIAADETVEMTIEMEKKEYKVDIIAGIVAHFGTFGLFNVDNSFTKAEYSLGFTPYVDFQLLEFLALGIEVMNIWGKPETQDPLRMIICPNIRVHILFSPYEKWAFDILLASGFTWWPENDNEPYVTGDLNETRIGWDFRAMGGIEYAVTKVFSLYINFGYWASSSTVDNESWITHDTMLVSFGPKLRF